MFDIKYSIVPVFDNYTGLNLGILGYVASPCYFISSFPMTFAGEDVMQYEVVFVRNKNNCSLENYPLILGDGKCINSEIIHELYDSFYTAKALANEKNKYHFDLLEGKLMLNGNKSQLIECINYVELMQDTINSYNTSLNPLK